MRHIFIQACIRGMIFGMSFLLVFLGGLSMTTMFASENPGGRFGEILNSILASGNWQTDTTGKVRDSARLGWRDASEYVRLWANRSCGANQCVYGIDMSGNVMCR